MDKATFFFPLEVPQETAEKIAEEIAERCTTDASKISVIGGNAGWHMEITAHHFREPDRSKIYPFLYGVEFALRQLT